MEDGEETFRSTGSNANDFYYQQRRADRDNENDEFSMRTCRSFVDCKESNERSERRVRCDCWCGCDEILSIATWAPKDSTDKCNVHVG